MVDQYKAFQVMATEAMVEALGKEAAELAQSLASKFKGEVTYKEIKGHGHNTIELADTYWESVREFLSRF